MEGVLVCWNDPPSPEKLINEKFVGYYHAGEIYNCRCYPQPIVKLNFVKWPAKVYYQGKIQRMSRKQFEEILTRTAFRDICKRVKFNTYDDISKQYEAMCVINKFNCI